MVKVEVDEPAAGEEGRKNDYHQEDNRTGTLARVKNRVSKALSFTHRPKGDRHSTTVASINRRRSSTISSVSGSASLSSGEVTQRTETRIDPSTNMDPLQDIDGDANMGHLPSNAEVTAAAAQKNRNKRKRKDVSKHVFFISNSQTRLKLYAKNEVIMFISCHVLNQLETDLLPKRQMMQWITALEKTAKQSHWVGGNRFDSYAPIRLNVAAQWLVDGVRCCQLHYLKLH